MGANQKIYVSIPGVPGTVKDPGYMGWLEAIGTGSTGDARVSTGAGASRVPQTSEIWVSFKPGVATVRLSMLAAHGRHLDTLRIAMVKPAKAGSELVYEMELTNAFAVSYVVDEGMEMVTFSPLRIKVRYPGKP
jgi:type VI protein secretion system component Hcp